MKPNEIASKRFDKAMSGYRVDEVDAFLASVAQEMALLLEEQEELEQKIDFLADKLEEYKRDEDSLKSAVFEAQKLGSSLVRDAKAKAERIVQEANEKAHFITTDASTRADAKLNECNRRCEEIAREHEDELAQQTELFERLKTEVSQFKRRMMDTYREHIELLSQLPEYVAAEHAQAAAAAKAQEEQAKEALEDSYEAFDETYAEVDEPETETYDAYEENAYEPENESYEAVAEDEEFEEEQISEEEPEADYADEMLQDTVPIPSLTPEPQLSEVPTPRENRRGALKFGENYDIRNDSERPSRGKRRK